MGEPRARTGAVVGVSFAVIGIGAAGVNTMGYLIPEIQADLGIGRASAGAVTGLFFGATGATAPVAARVVARIGPRRAVLGAATVFATMSLAAVLSGTYAVLVAFGALCGFSYAIATVATNVAVGTVMPPERRAIGLSAKTSGGPLLSAVFALIAGLGVTSLGWRGVVSLHTALAVAIVAGAAVTMRGLAFTMSPPTTPAQRRARGRLPGVVRVLGVAAFLFSFGAQAFFSWLLPYMKDELQVSSGSAGLFTSASTAMAVVSMIVVARLADRLRRETRMRLVAAVNLAACLAALSVAAVGTRSLVVVVLAAAVGISSYAAMSGLMHSVIVELAPDDLERATGAVITGYFLGMWCSPIAFGWTADTAGFRAAWVVSGVALAVATSINLLSRSAANRVMSAQRQTVGV